MEFKAQGGGATTDKYVAYGNAKVDVDMKKKKKKKLVLFKCQKICFTL